MDELLVLAGGFLSGVLAVTVVQILRARKHSRELKTNAEMWRQLFDTSPDGMVIVDRRGIILHVNKKAEAVFGYARKELLGAPVEILVPVKLREQHRIDRELYSAAPRPRPMGTPGDLHARRKDGSEFPVEIELTPLQSSENGLVIAALVVDITARRQAEEALRESEARFRSAFEHGPIGVTLLGRDGRMIKPNPELCRMFGYSEEELARMTPLEITHPEDLGVSTNLMKDIFKDDKDDPICQKAREALRQEGWRNHVGELERKCNSRPRGPSPVRHQHGRRHYRPQARGS